MEPAKVVDSVAVPGIGSIPLIEVINVSKTVTFAWEPNNSPDPSPKARVFKQQTQFQSLTIKYEY